MSDTPEHYTIGGISPWDYCAAKFAESFDDHLLITAIEYISRAKHKAGAADIRKAYNNLGHWLKRNEPETQPKPQPEPADDGKRYRLEYINRGLNKWIVWRSGLTRQAAESMVAGEFGRRVVEDTPEPQPEPQPEPIDEAARGAMGHDLFYPYEVQRCSATGEWQSDYRGGNQSKGIAIDIMRDRVRHYRVSYRIVDRRTGQVVAEREPEGGAA